LDDAVRFADAAERSADATTGVYRALLVDLIAIAARAHDGDLRRRLANQVERLAHSIDDPPRDAVHAAAAVIAAQTGNTDTLEALVGTMDKRDVGRAVFGVAAHIGDIIPALAIADTVGDLR